MLISMASTVSASLPVHLPLTRVNYGVTFTFEGSLQITPEYWSHTFDLEVPTGEATSPARICKHQDEQVCNDLHQLIHRAQLIHSQCIAEFNLTLERALKLIPEFNLPETKSRSKRAILPFVGDMSKSLFGTATFHDVKILAAHIAVLHKQDGQFTKAFQQFGNHMQSAMSSIDKRVSNSFRAIQDNHAAISELGQETQRSFSTLLAGVNLAGMMQKQAQLTNNVLRQAEEFYLGIQTLVQGKLSPSLLPPEAIKEILNKTQMIISERYPTFQLAYSDPSHYYAIPHFAFARLGRHIYVTLQFPLTTAAAPGQLYSVETFPIPINQSSDHATQLLDQPPYIFLTSDQSEYTCLTHQQLSRCRGSNPKYCPFSVPLTSQSKQSCLSALFSRNNEKVHEICDFRFLQNIIKPNLQEIGPGKILVSNIDNITVSCPQHTYSTKGCKFCVVKIPCECMVLAASISISAHITNCHNDTKTVSKWHPVNLALLQSFFGPEDLESIKDDTLFSNPIDVNIPPFKLFRHNFSELIASDQKQHLSLRRMAAAAAADQDIFQTLADPILDGKLPNLDTTWSIVVKYLSLTSSVMSVLLTVVVIWQLKKIYSLSMAVTLLQKVAQSEAASFTHPPLYFLQATHTTLKSEIISETSDLTALYVIVAFLLAIALIVAIIKRRSNCRTTLTLEISNGDTCVRVPITSLKACPRNWHLAATTTVKAVSVTGRVFPTITVGWGDLNLSNTITGNDTTIPKDTQINVLKAWRLSNLIQKPFVVQILLVHAGIAYTAPVCAPGGCRCNNRMQTSTPLYPVLDLPDN